MRLFAFWQATSKSVLPSSFSALMSKFELRDSSSRLKRLLRHWLKTTSVSGGPPGAEPRAPCGAEVRGAGDWGNTVEA